MAELLDFAPTLRDIGATFIIVALLFYAERQASRQHERSLQRDKLASEQSASVINALMECLKEERERSG